MTIIKKSDILEGIGKVEKVQIDSLGGELYLRPLSSAELNEINYIEAEGLGNFEQNTRSKTRTIGNADLTQTNKFNILKVTKASDKAKYTMIEKSLDNPKYVADPWEMSDIKQLPRPAIDEIHIKVQELSGVNVTESDVKQFPED